MSYAFGIDKDLIQQPLHQHVARLAQPRRRMLSPRRQKGALATAARGAVSGAVAEALEGRRLLSFTASYSSVTRVLTVTGSTGPDNIQVYQATANTVVKDVDTGMTVYSGASSGIDKIVIAGNAGADTIQIANSDNNVSSPVTVGCDINGGADNDNIDASDSNDTIVGGTGQDVVRGQEGNDLIEGDTSNTSTASSTTLPGNEDNLSGDEGNDTIEGQDSGDTVNGNEDADSLFGDYATSTGMSDAGDTINGGAGADTIACDSSGSSYGGNDVVDAGSGDDNINAFGGNDSVTCGAGNDHCTGDDGADSLTGNEGDDSLYGGNGYDTIDLGSGADLAFGEDGADLFQGVQDGEHDTIDGGLQNDSIEFNAFDGFDSILNL